MKKLYRGVSAELDALNQGILKPYGNTVSSSVDFGQEGAAFRAGYTWGESLENGVLAHQVDSGMKNLGFISTSTSFEVARHFATRGNTCDGYMYTLDVEKFQGAGVKIVESEHSPYPDENEISIYAEDGGCIPDIVILTKQFIKKAQF
ncbi:MULTISPECIES: hypothetical protein [Rheinheimera]|uniref:hypothetical protein n=1 Tax=Rheinheimera TaxID=67575 RepID=UPI00074745A2|nr:MULTISPECIES: hypothetical protein [Rheinheimera]KUM54037.1 hypothetical protein AR688_11845 [Rheinheimera sp. EpRS3]